MLFRTVFRLSERNFLYWESSPTVYIQVQSTKYRRPTQDLALGQTQPDLALGRWPHTETSS